MVLIGWFSLNKIKKHKIAEIFLIGMSLWFYAYFNFSYLFIIVGSCLFNFFISYFINKVEKKECVSNIDYNYKSKKIKVLGILGIILNLGILFYYKYYDFFIENVNLIFNKDYNLKHILLPLGISFFRYGLQTPQPPRALCKRNALQLRRPQRLQEHRAHPQQQRRVREHIQQPS